MNKMDHTPAPWKTGEVMWNEDGDVQYTLHGIKAARVGDCRLIAAAPTLLAALSALVAVGDGTAPDTGHAWEAAREAIAKVEGKP